MVCVDIDRFPRIELSPEDQRAYDEQSAALVARTLKAYVAEGPRIDSARWSLVRRRGEMSVYKNTERSTNPKVSLFLGRGLMDGSVDDVMDGLYCDTTEDLRAVKALLEYKFVDGGVFQVSQRRSQDAPYRFAGIKWFAAKSPLGRLVDDRDLLTYETMGQVTDELGYEFAFHTYQSIERPEWPADALKGIKRAHTSTCYLYRTHSREQVEVFFQGDFVARGTVAQPLSDYAMAGKWLAVSNSIRCAQAKRLIALMESASNRRCYPRFVDPHCRIGLRHQRLILVSPPQRCVRRMPHARQVSARHRALRRMSSGAQADVMV